MIYKGGVARYALCVYLGVSPEVIKDIDEMSSFEEDINALDSGGDLTAYMSSRDVSINEVAIVDGKLYWTQRAEQSFLNREVVLLEGTARAYFRAARFAARFGFSLNTNEFEINDIRAQDDQEWHEQAILQWSKAIEEGCDELFLSRVSQYWMPARFDQPIPWRSVKRELERRHKEDLYYLDLQDVELSFGE